MPSTLKPATLAHLLLLVVVFIWGATFTLVKDALRDITPLLFNLLRMALAFACVALFYRKQWRSLTPRAWASGAVVGVCLAIGYQFQTAGLALTSPSKSAFITGLVVVLVPLLSAIPRLRSPSASRPRWNAWIGALLAFGGIVLLTTPAHMLPSQSGGRLFASLNTGDLLTLCCALGFAFHVLALARASQHIRFQALAMLQLGFCALTMAITLPLFEHPHIALTPRLCIALVFTALFATALAFSVQSYAQQHLPATHTALLLALEPVFAWLTSWLILHDRLGTRGSIGALLILAGILITELLPVAAAGKSGSLQTIHSAHEAG